MANVKLGTKAVGSVLKLNLNGSPKNFIVVHQGKPSSLYDDSCDGTWVLMQDIYNTREWDNNDNNYRNSTLQSWLNNTFVDLFDLNIRDAIKTVKIPYVNGTGGSAVASGANGLSCKIFLLSGYELGWTKSDNSYFPQDGAKLDYFTAGSQQQAHCKVQRFGRPLVDPLAEHARLRLRLARPLGRRLPQLLVQQHLRRAPRFCTSLYTLGL